MIVVTTLLPAVARRTAGKSAVSSRCTRAAAASCPTRLVSHAERTNAAAAAAASAGSARAARSGPSSRRSPVSASANAISGMPAWKIASYSCMAAEPRKGIAQPQPASASAASGTPPRRANAPASAAAHEAAPRPTSQGHSPGSGHGSSHGVPSPRRSKAANGSVMPPMRPSCPSRNAGQPT